MTCETHHHACDCRERLFRILLVAAKSLVQSQERFMSLSFPVQEDDDGEFWHYSDMAHRECEDIRRLWVELK